MATGAGRSPWLAHFRVTRLNPKRQSLLRLCALLLLFLAPCTVRAQPAGGPAVSAQAAGAQTTAPAPFFAPPATTIRVPDQLLSAAERAFLAEHPVLRVALTRDDFSPFVSIAADGRISGFSVKALGAVAQALGIRLEPVLFENWSQMLNGVRERRADLIAHLGYSDERATFLAYTLGVAREPSALIGRADGRSYLELPTLAGVRVAVGKDRVAHAALSKLYPAAIEVPVDGIAEGLRAVNEGRADLMMESLLQTLGKASRLGITGLEVKAQVPLGSGWSHIAVRSDWAPLAHVLSRVIAGGRAQLGQDVTDSALPFLGRTRLVEPLNLSPAELDQLDRIGTLRIGAVRGLQMLNDYSDALGHSGIGAEFAAIVSASLGAPTTVIPFDSVSAMLEGATRGQVDLIPLLTRTPQRERDFSFSTPYLEMPYVLVAATDGPMYWSLASLGGKRIALSRAHPLIPILQQRYPSISILEVEDGGQALAAVADGRAQAAAEIKLYAHHLIQQRYPDDLRVIEPIADLPAAFSFAAPKQQAALIPLVDRALAALPRSESQRIEKRWIAVDLQPVAQMRRYLKTGLLAGAGLLSLIAAMMLWNRRLAAETERRRAAEQRLVDMTDQIQTAVFQLRSGKDRAELVFANRAARQMFQIADGTTGFTKLQILGMVDIADRKRIAAALLHAQRTMTVFNDSYRFRFPDGRLGWLYGQSAPRRLGDGTTLWSGYVVDLSKERAMQDQLRTLLRAKDMFVATASHELKTPLQGISLILQWLGGTALSSEQRKRVGEASDETRTLSILIDDLLDLSRIESGNLTLEEASLDLPALVRSVAATFELARRSKGLGVSVLIDEGVPRYVIGDAIRLRQVLVNLVGNAIKYTPAGQVIIRLAPRADDSPPASGNDEKRCALLLRVSDTGIGIDADRLARIFEPFLQHAEGVPQQASPVLPGSSSTGLGLSICKRIVELMGGRIGIASRPGEGTVASVELDFVVAQHPPLDGGAAMGDSGDGGAASAADIAAADAAAVDFDAAADAAAADAGTASVDGAGSAGIAAMRVLLVEDNQLNRVLMARALGEHGLRVEQAADGAQALELWREHVFDVLITDLRMPNMNGIELARQVRQLQQQQGWNARALLIALTASAAIEDRDGTGARLFDHTVVKPARVAELVKIAERAAIAP